MTIEDRRAALKVGDVIRDQELLAKGMRVEGGGVLCPRTIGDNGRPTEGGYSPHHSAAAWKRLVREIGVRFVGWAKDESSLDELATLGERRAALKAGDVITDPALLAVGMRVATGVRPTQLLDREVYRVDECGIAFADGGQFRNESIRRGKSWERVEFLGWGQDAKPVERGTLASVGAQMASCILAGMPDPRVCDSTRCEFHHDPSDTACVRARHRTPAPTPKALPFKRHPKCTDTGWHAENKLCLSCEEFIAEEMAKLPKPYPQRPEPHQPAPSGLGGTVGPILSRLR